MRGFGSRDGEGFTDYATQRLAKHHTETNYSKTNHADRKIGRVLDNDIDGIFGADLASF